MTVAPDTPATATGAALTGGNNMATVAAAGTSLTINVNGTPVVFDFYDGDAAPYAGANIGIDVQTTAPVSITTALAAIQTGLRASGGAAAADATVGINGGGDLEITLGSNTVASMTITDGTAGLGLAAGPHNPVRPSLTARVATVEGADSAEFIRQTIAGGATTVYAQNGAPVNVQLRWAKIDSAETGGVERWNLFYLSDSTATGSNPMWTNVGTDYTFTNSGTLSPPINSINLTGLTINGVVVGNVVLNHGANGVTQFADANGTASASISQNGYGAGEFSSVAINDNGRVVASYSNGQQVELAQVVTANFNATNQLKRLDGGVFSATSESGEAVYSTDGGIIGSALESSNTDISEEFTKLIVTQQAYAAGTRIVSTADQMLQEALNMVR
jgi:flagellar hook protein FlgE